MAVNGTMSANPDYPIDNYSPPSWTSTMKPESIPKYRIKLATLTTPIQRWRLPGIPDEFEVYIKRDDMTGSVLTGNKVRKLEFLMADAASKNCQSVIACGGVFSNSCRAAAIAARQMGMDSHLLIWSKKGASLPFSGNALLDKLVGSHFYLMPLDCPFDTDVYPRMRQLKEHLVKTTGQNVYMIPFGGSNEVGVWGYIEGYRELMAQGLHEGFTDVVIAAGSSGSVSGLAIANHLTGSKLKVHGMAACLTRKYFHDEADKMLRFHGLQNEDGTTGVKAAEIENIVETVGLGYGVNTPEELDCIENVALKTGIMLDPVYSGKAMYHMIKGMNENPNMFKGRKVLFIHTGGIYDLFTGAFTSRMESRSQEENNVFDWMELTDKVPCA